MQRAQRSLVLALGLWLPLVSAAAQSHLEGATGSHAFGYSVDRAGDLDGDGHEDIIVGDPWDGTNGKNAGSASAISLAAGKVLWRIYGSKPEDKLGHSVSGAGDQNGDGFDDVVVGVPGRDTGVGVDSGMAKVVSGRDGSILRYFLGFQPEAQLGSSVDGGMDLNLDGIPDLLVGAQVGGTGKNSTGTIRAGEVHVISGKGGYLHVVEGDRFADLFGASVAMLGDVNGDGHPDWVAGAPWGWDPGQNGSVHLGYFKVHSGKDAQLLRHVAGPQDKAWFGASVASAGDADGDAVPDVVVGAPAFSSVGGYRNGRAQVWSVAKQTILNDLTGPNDSDFGASVAGIGDVTGDLLGDIAVGAPRYNDKKGPSGAAFVWRGNFPQLLAAWPAAGDENSFGNSVAGLGPYYGKGQSLLIGVPFDYGHYGSTSGTGSVVVKNLD